MGKAIRGLSEELALKPGARPGPSPTGGVAASGAEASREEADSRPSIGGYLERQRRLRGISLEELASLTRIPVRSLERLEGGAHDGDADGFSRGFVRTVAVAIGLDPEETVARMLPEVRVGRKRISPGWRQALLLAGLMALGGGAAAAGLSWWQARSAAGPAPVALPVRSDAVRALAIGQGLLAPDAPAVARPLPPVDGPSTAAEEPPDAGPAPVDDPDRPEAPAPDAAASP
jgi:hypothetical protein